MNAQYRNILGLNSRQNVEMDHFNFETKIEHFEREKR